MSYHNVGIESNVDWGIENLHLVAKVVVPWQK